MNPSIMLDNIRSQPESLRCLVDYHLGEGKPALLQAASAIRSAKSVVFTGMGSSMSASIPAVYYLESHGFPAEVVETSEWLHFGRAKRRSDAEVLISRSGETVEIIKLLKRLEDSTSVTVGITNEPGTTLERESDYPIFLASGPDRMVAVQTYTGTMALLLLLAAAILEEPEEQTRRVLAAVVDAMTAEIEKSVAQAGEWEEFLRGSEVVYLLARGPSLASAREGSLLFNEAARLPSVGMSCALFRHGPVEIVDQRFRAIVFASQEPTREIDLAMAIDLAKLGGKARVCQAQGVPSAFAPLVEIIPVQVAACHVAQTRGIDPGAFRYAGLVTTTESGFEKT